VQQKLYVTSVPSVPSVAKLCFLVDPTGMPGSHLCYFRLRGLIAMTVRLRRRVTFTLALRILLVAA
jgi:hypothetical protein